MPLGVISVAVAAAVETAAAIAAAVMVAADAFGQGMLWHAFTS